MNILKYIFCIALINLSITTIAQNSKVARVIDGDTFETITGEKIRLIGINAPEISDIFGIESKEYLSRLIFDNEVELIPDNVSNNTDRYGRSLRYVLLNGTDINKKMIADGYAIAYLKYKFSKSEEYRNEQLKSMNLDKGMWNGSNERKDEINNSLSETNKKVTFNKKKLLFFLPISVLLIMGIFYYYKKG